MSSEFLKIDKFLLGKGFCHKPPVISLNGTVWLTYWKENDRCAVEFVVADNDTIRFKLFSKAFKTVDYYCVSECEIKWCHLEDLMELLGM